MFMSQFDSRFPLRHQQKDMRLAIGMADEVEQPLHVTASANEVTAVGHMLSAKVVVVILFSNICIMCSLVGGVQVIYQMEGSILN